MKQKDEFKLTNELLEKVLGGRSFSSSPKVFSFNGAYASQQADLVRRINNACGCGCGCGGGAGMGNGAG